IRSLLIRDRSARLRHPVLVGNNVGLRRLYGDWGPWQVKEGRVVFGLYRHEYRSLRRPLGHEKQQQDEHDVGGNRNPRGLTPAIAREIIARKVAEPQVQPAIQHWRRGIRRYGRPFTNWRFHHWNGNTSR